MQMNTGFGSMRYGESNGELMSELPVPGEKWRYQLNDCESLEEFCFM